MPGTAGESESDGAVLARLGTDGEKWAAEFCRVGWNEGGRQFLGELEPGGGGFLHGWLCNAIEAGRSAGYAQANRDRETEADRVADELDGRRLEPLTATAAAQLIRRKFGSWRRFEHAAPPVVVADRTSELPENLAGSDLPENLAGSDLPADLAGSYEFPRVMERIAEALEALASTVSPTTAYGWAAPSIRTDPAR